LSRTAGKVRGFDSPQGNEGKMSKSQEMRTAEDYEESPCSA